MGVGGIGHVAVLQQRLVANDVQVAVARVVAVVVLKPSVASLGLLRELVVGRLHFLLFIILNDLHALPLCRLSLVRQRVR